RALSARLRPSQLVRGTGQRASSRPAAAGLLPVLDVAAGLDDRERAVAHGRLEVACLMLRGGQACPELGLVERGRVLAHDSCARIGRVFARDQRVPPLSPRVGGEVVRKDPRTPGAHCQPMFLGPRSQCARAIANAWAGEESNLRAADYE